MIFFIRRNVENLENFSSKKETRIMDSPNFLAYFIVVVKGKPSNKHKIF